MTQDPKGEEPNHPALIEGRVDAEPEKTGAVAHKQPGFKYRIRGLRSFFRTRRRIIKGDYLFDRTADELKQDALMGPLTFNIFSAAIAGTIALAASKLYDFYFHSDLVSGVFPPNARGGDPLSRKFEELFPLVKSFSEPYLVPIIFLVVAYCISWGTIRGSDPGTLSLSDEWASSLPPSRTRGRNAFLYFDGAYGFLPQCLLSLAVTLLRSVSNEPFAITTDPRLILEVLPTPVFVLSLLTMGVTIFYSAFLTYYRFPRLMFRAMGYFRSKDDSQSDDPAPVSDRPPWSKYILTAIFLVPVVTVLVAFLYSGVGYVVARFVATVVVFFRGDL